MVQLGDLYRLTPPDAHTVVVQYLAGAETVVLAWRPMARHPHPTRPVRLAGLDPRASYRDGDTVHSGAVLTHHGLDLSLPPGDYASAVVHLRRA